MKEITAVGRTIEEAVDSGLKQIQLLQEEVEITIVDEGNKGFLGLFGKRQAVVKLVE
ncbi:Jag N-terminal domain-containing protein, partial [Listeria monocytogenes]